MREIVARQFQRLGLVARGNQGKLRVAGKGAGKVHQFTIHPRGKRRLGKAGADRGRHIGGA